MARRSNTEAFEVPSCLVTTGDNRHAETEWKSERWKADAGCASLGYNAAVVHDKTPVPAASC
jgi:hypothetical protein